MIPDQEAVNWILGRCCSDHFFTLIHSKERKRRIMCSDEVPLIDKRLSIRPPVQVPFVEMGGEGYRGYCSTLGSTESREQSTFFVMLLRQSSKSLTSIPCPNALNNRTECPKTTMTVTH